MRKWQLSDIAHPTHTLSASLTHLSMCVCQANDYTVEVDSDGSLDSMMLTLCTTDRATDRFKTLESHGATA